MHQNNLSSFYENNKTKHNINKQMILIENSSLVVWQDSIFCFLNNITYPCMESELWKFFHNKAVKDLLSQKKE